MLGEMRQLYSHILDSPRLYQNRVFKWLQDEKGHVGLRPNFLPVIGLLVQEPMRLTSLSEKVGMRKQHCTRLVNSMEEAGYVFRERDAEDQRAQNLTITANGRRFVADGITYSEKIAQQLRLILGDSGLSELQNDLIAVCRGLNLESRFYGDVIANRHSSDLLVFRMVALAEYCADYVNRTVRNDGFPDIRRKHAEILRHVAISGARMQDLSGVSELSKQTISGTVNELFAMGYVTLETDPEDKRSKFIQFANRGKKMFRVALKIVDGLMNKIKFLLGAESFERFRARMKIVYKFLASHQSLVDSDFDKYSTAKAVPSLGDVAVYLISLMVEREQQIFGLARNTSGSDRILEQLTLSIDSAHGSLEEAKFGAESRLSKRQKKLLQETLWNIMMIDHSAGN